MTHTPLPIPDFEHLPLGDVQSRIRSLDASGLRTLIDFEQQHGARTPVLQALNDRQDQLAAGSQPSGGNPGAFDPQRPGPASSTFPKGQVTPETSGPPMNPPSQGDPTNPAQPRT
jgi:hypothetical protein